MKRLLAVVTLALLLGSFLPTYAQESPNYELTGGWWFNGMGFVREKLYVVRVSFRRDVRRASIASSIWATSISFLPSAMPTVTPTTIQKQSRMSLRQISAMESFTGFL